MKPDTLRRLSALESQQAHDDPDPAPLHRAFIEAGIEAPAPHPEEHKRDWLRRVPTASLEALLELTDGVDP